MIANIVVALAIAIAQANPPVGKAAEIRIFTARALATVLAEIGGEFERATGHKLIVSSDLPTGFLRRVNAGDHFDVLISGAVPVDEWIRDGRLVAMTRTELARSGIGVEVRTGSPKRPDSDIVSELVAKGDVELGMTVITQILTTRGVELVGPLPAEVQSHVTFVAAVGAQSNVKGAANELIAFLKGPRAIAVMKTQGMEPR